jgi:hypothetical protein
MADRQARPSLLAQLSVVLLILIPLCGVVWPVVRDTRGPRGEAIPLQPPDERNRVHHPLGFSLVAPPNWDRHISGSLVLIPKTPGRYARRSRASIVVTRLGNDQPADLKRLEQTSFLGRSAHEGMQIVRPWTFDDGALSEYTLYVTHGGDWYEIRYSIAEERTQLPGEVRRYLNTLRWEEGASHTCQQSSRDQRQLRATERESPPDCRGGSPSIARRIHRTIGSNRADA